jgi:hypothetical protein
MGDAKKKPLARSIGEFVGILVDAAKTDVTVPKPTVVRESVEEVRVETPEGPLTLRRRVIDEVEPTGRRETETPS